MISDQSTFLSSCTEGGTLPWMSPELLDPAEFGLKESRPTKKSDCYALGMVVYEVLSGQVPYAPSKGPAIIRKILHGERPERPRENEGKLFTDRIWEVVELCWEPRPGDRASAKAVLLCLEGDPLQLRSLSSSTGRGGETYPGDLSDATASGSSMFSSVSSKVSGSPSIILVRPVSCTEWQRTLCSITRFSSSRDGRRLRYVPPTLLRSLAQCCISGPPTTNSKNGLPVPPRDRPPGTKKRRTPLQNGGQKRGRLGKLVRNARRLFKAIVRKFGGL